MTKVFAWTRARAVVSEDELKVRVYNGPSGSYMVLSVEEWWHRLGGEPAPPVSWFRPDVGLRRASVLTPVTP